MNEFYVGYLPKAPVELAKFIRRVVVTLGFVAVVASLLLLRGQRPFADSVFEFGRVSTFEGVIAAQPYPTLLVARPGESARLTGYSDYLLVAPGKHGADLLVVAWDGRPVRLRGQLIYRDGHTMVEVEPGSITARESGAVTAETTRHLGAVTIAGEIVDSKCYLGVMNPGSGKVHRDCAARCLSGGIPPLFIAVDGRRQFLLVGTDGHALAQDALREFIAEPITIHGDLLQRGETQVLRIDPQSLRHSPEGWSRQAMAVPAR